MPAVVAAANFLGMPTTELEEREERDAAAGGAAKRDYVRRIFSEIAPRYDLLNHLLSLNIDRAWRRRAIAALRWDRRPDGLYVDVCAGTLDVSVALAGQRGFTGRVVAADFAEPMLRGGRDKVGALAVCPVVANAQQLPLPDQSAAGALIAFGARNLASLEAGLAELHRVLAPGARLVVLEFSTPRAPLVRVGYHLYFRHVLPRVGRLVSGHPTAYSYLPDSVSNFPAVEQLAQLMRAAGFTSVGWRSLSFGIAALHHGERAA